MDKALLTVEVAALIVAAVFGILWATNQDGRYEPITFLCLLLGSTLTEIIRRHLSDPKINRLEKIVHDLLEGLERGSNQKGVAPAEAIHADARHATEKVAEPKEIRDDLTKRIHSLLADRSNLVERIKKLAKLRGISLEGQDPAALCKALRLPTPFGEGAMKVLEFTDPLSSKDVIDIRYSGWVDTMASAVVGYLDHVIENTEKAPNTAGQADA